MRAAELKALARECGLRGYSWMRKAEIIELIRNNQQGLASWAPDMPPRSVGPKAPPRNGTTPLGGAQALRPVHRAGPPQSGGPKVPPAPPRPMQPNQT